MDYFRNFFRFFISRIWETATTITAQDQLLFHELYRNCRYATPDAQLSSEIQNRLNIFSKTKRQKIVMMSVEGCSPLFMACKNGSLKIVKYLIEQCDANLEQYGECINMEDGSRHFVSPLWVACYERKYNVVRYLVRHGVNINSISDTGLTAVQVACSEAYSEIVMYLVENNADILMPDYDGATCLMKSINNVYLCDFLLQHGADVNSQDLNSETVLHHAIQESRFEIIKLLVSKGANPCIRNRKGDDALQTACLKGDSNVIYYLIKSYNYPLERFVETYELIGSAILEEHQNSEMCLYFWQISLNYRYNQSDRCLNKFIRDIPYASVTEFTSFEELESLKGNIDGMYIQSLLVCERILGPLHKDMIIRLQRRSEAYYYDLRYQSCFNLWRHSLEKIIQRDGILQYDVSVCAIRLVKIFLKFQEQSRDGILPENINFEDVYGSALMFLRRLEDTKALLNIRPVFKMQQMCFDKILKVLTHLIYALHTTLKTPNQVIAMKELITDLLKIEPRNSIGGTIFHLAVSTSNNFRKHQFGNLIFPNTDIVELLLLCGANVDITDHNLNTPLHIAATVTNFKQELIELLLKYGAHIDRKNGDGFHPNSMLQCIPEYTLYHLQYTTLKCLTARKVRHYEIEYTGKIPADLENFIKIH